VKAFSVKALISLTRAREERPNPRSWAKLWSKIKTWLMARACGLHLAAVLDHCCDGLGELVGTSWSGLLVLMLTPASEVPRRARKSARGALRGSAGLAAA
jgi:hypothetical protein